MITTKTRQQIERMHSAGKYLAELLALLKETAVPGITTARLNEIAEGWLVRKNFTRRSKVIEDIHQVYVFL